MPTDDEFDEAIETLRELIPAFPRTPNGMKLAGDYIQKFVGRYASREQLFWMVETAIEESAHWPERPTVVPLLKEIWLRKYPRADRPESDEPASGSESVPISPAMPEGEVPGGYANEHRRKRTREMDEWVVNHPGLKAKAPRTDFCPLYQRWFGWGEDPCSPLWCRKGYEPRKKSAKYAKPGPAEVEYGPARSDEQNERLIRELELELESKNHIIRRLEEERIG